MHLDYALKVNFAFSPLSTHTHKHTYTEEENLKVLSQIFFLLIYLFLFLSCSVASPSRFVMLCHIRLHVNHLSCTINKKPNRLYINKVETYN